MYTLIYNSDAFNTKDIIIPSIKINEYDDTLLKYYYYLYGYNSEKLPLPYLINFDIDRDKYKYEIINYYWNIFRFKWLIYSKKYKRIYKFLKKKKGKIHFICKKKEYGRKIDKKEIELYIKYITTNIITKLRFSKYIINYVEDKNLTWNYLEFEIKNVKNYTLK